VWSLSKEKTLSKQSAQRRPRGTLWALLAIVAALMALLASPGIAQADTSGPGEPTTTAAFAPASPSLAPGATLAGAVEGSSVSVHIAGDGNFFGLNIARLCKTGQNFQFESQLDPGDFGNCIVHPFVNGSDDDAIGPVQADPVNHTVDFTFRVGTGSQTFTENDGTTQSTITCDSTHPCALWLSEAVSASVNTNNVVLKHYEVTYTGRPDSPAVTSTPGNGKLTIDLTPPSNTGNSASPLSYSVTVSGANCPTPAGCTTQTGTGTHYVFQPLTNSQQYTVSATAKSTAANGTTQFTSTPATTVSNASTTPIPPPSTALTQTISATRPGGALVLTQICGNHGSTTGGTAPTYTGSANGIDGTTPGSPDGLFPQYPYPTDNAGNPIANYPTNCGLTLSQASFITSGAGAGQFFQATGPLNQLTVVDTRDTDPGFAVDGVMGQFSNGTDSFGGGQLGWHPIVTSTTPSFTTTDGSSYTQTVAAGGDVAPNTQDSAGGLGSSGASGNGETLASAAAGHGLGIAKLDANLTLWIPVFAQNGTYTGTLTISAV
jgi:hypothetical protein